jgi:hypothetical protein
MDAFRLFLALTSLSLASCALMDEQAPEQAAPAAAQGPAHEAATERRDALEKPAAFQESAQVRTDLMPLGYPIAELNHLTGLRTDPHGSEEGRGHVELKTAQAEPSPTERVPFDPKDPWMAGFQGAGGTTGGTARPADAPHTTAQLAEPPPSDKGKGKGKGK